MMFFTAKIIINWKIVTWNKRKERRNRTAINKNGSINRNGKKRLL